MDAKITLSFDSQVIERAKKYAEKQNMSLSRLMEILLDKVTAKQYASIEEYPIADWVNMVSEGKAEYTRKNKKTDLKSEFRERKKQIK